MTSEPNRTAITYRDAGVDIDAASEALNGVREAAHSTFGVGEAAMPLGHFGGVYRLSGGPERFLVASADGIGTKIKLAFVLGGETHAGVGRDLVNHCVNDLLACGARPLFFLDYIATGALNPETVTALVQGMATACRHNGVALIGGETAEMPGLYAAGEYDVAGFIVGEVAPSSFVDGSAIEIGDLLIGLPALGLHTNGYSLARKALGLTGEAAHDLPVLHAPLPADPGITIGEALMAPHPSYLPSVMPLLEAGKVRGMAHITGGGLVDNVPRMLPDGTMAVFEAEAWTPNPVFALINELGQVPPREQYRAFNMGIGFVLAVGREDAEAVLADIPGSRIIGLVAEHSADGTSRVAGLPTPGTG